MAELKKSVTSYRRTGSSGLVWNNKHVSEFRDPNQTNANQGGDVEVKPQSLRQSKSVGPGTSVDSAVSRSQSTRATIFWKVKVASPSKDPPSPKLPTCGFFCFPVFTTQHLYSKSRKRR
ncbi:hypothetical protein K1719_011805 [Acacia pycnantha]|nr:hypothetical protein K1719_011805 [Acacia pycnantha]